MEAARARPENIEHVAMYDDGTGLTSLGYLLMGWREGMVISDVVGIVMASQAMGGDGAKFNGHKVVLAFDAEPTQLLAVKAWKSTDNAELARALVGTRVHLRRLAVLEPKRGTAVTADNSFLFTLAFNQFSALNILHPCGGPRARGEA
uniref:Thioesterase domain-containing protein n=1 Tax=Globodera pallida TaxID=36090 RepID=A0A183BN36_GLOPA